MKLSIEVTGCSDCPCKTYHRGHGESWDYCSHPKAPKFYENILEDGERIASWCPIKGDVVAEVKDKPADLKEIEKYLNKDIEALDEFCKELQKMIAEQRRMK